MIRKLLVPAALLLLAVPVALAQTAAAILPAPPVSNSDPMKVDDGVVQPVLIHSAEPKFARGADHRRSDDIVLVGFIVDRAGKPVNIHVVRSSDPDFDKASITAVSKYRFKPATLHGEPVAVELKVEIKFHSD